MSNLSTYPTPYQVVLKPGLYQSQNTKGGLNLNKWFLKALTKVGFAGTSDPVCCEYFPTAPEVTVVDHTAPTEDEMVNVPLGGFFQATEADGTWAVRIKTTLANSVLLAANV